MPLASLRWWTYYRLLGSSVDIRPAWCMVGPTEQARGCGLFENSTVHWVGEPSNVHPSSLGPALHIRWPAREGGMHDLSKICRNEKTPPLDKTDLQKMAKNARSSLSRVHHIYIVDSGLSTLHARHLILSSPKPHHVDIKLQS